MKQSLDILTPENIAGGEFYKQIEAAIREVHKNIQKHGRDATHSIHINLPIDPDNSSDELWLIKSQTTVKCVLNSVATSEKNPVIVQKNGIYDANTQLTFED